MDRTGAELRAYYEHEAAERSRKPLTGRRVEIRARYLQLLADEGRRSVLDFGAGPGGDGGAFLEAGCSYVGIDLAHGNGVLAAEAGVTVVQGSISAPPFRPRSFDAGWSMSTLMHIPEPEVAAVLAAMTTPLAPGAPLQIGLWGGDRQDVVTESATGEQRRLFSYRPLELNRALLSTVGSVEQATLWDVVPDGASRGMQYQLFLVRVDSP